MKIHLILAAADNDPMRKNDPFMPLSLPLLAASAPDHDYTFTDMLWEDTPDTTEHYDLVGISARHTAEPVAYALADQFRKRGIKVVLGGAQISMLPFESLLHADAVVIGEAESLWPIILTDLVSDRLQSFYVCSPDQFDPRGASCYQLPRLPDLTTIATPLRHLYKRKYSFDTVFAARGCPVGCDFCCVSKLFGIIQRLRPAGQVAAEIDTFKNYYYLLDDTVFGRTFTYDYYLDLYKKIASLKKRRFWIGQGNLDAAAHEKGRDVIRAAADSGLIYAAIGLESINPATLKSSGAITKTGASGTDGIIDTMEENLRFIREQGIFVSGWFVVGYDTDTLDTYEQTLAFCKRNDILPVIMPVYALPGTKLYEKMNLMQRLRQNNFININNTKMPDNAVVSVVKRVANDGYSLQNCIKRTLAFSDTTRKRGINWRIHTTLFSLILQLKMKSGIAMWKSY
jgi:radical SAM superfamily enzyme YgiQ (UPF0313 family)